MSSYTDPFRTRDVSFPEFARRCARAMGGFIRQRDEPMDSPLRATEVNEYYHVRVRVAQQHLQDAMRMSDANIRATMLSEYDSAVQTYNDQCRAVAEIRARYEAMLAYVRAWTPPTVDHEPLREFMIRQLEESIEFDCRLKDPPQEPDVTDTGVSDRKTHIVAWAQEDLAHVEAAHERAIAKHQATRGYIEALEASLADYEKLGPA
jgi:hypothetical protein